MATSKPVYQNYVYQNGNLFCALYNRRVVNTSGVATTQWYWMPSNKSGDIIDFRANALNTGATYNSEASALLNIPSGYGTLVVDRWQSDKYISIMPGFPFENTASTQKAMSEFVALGANNIYVQVEYSDIYKSAAAQANPPLNAWDKVDPMITLAKSFGVKVSLIINLDMDDDWVGSFWGLANNEMDEWGKPLRIGYGGGHPSLANTSAMATIKDFFTQFVTRYADSSFLGNQFLQIIPTLTVHKEFGYNFTNQYYPVGSSDPVKEYFALSGYSSATISGFRTWLNSPSNPDKYNDKDAMNAAWGTTFGSFSVVTPPTTGKGVQQATLDDYAIMFSTNRGKDWYKYLSSLMYNFANDLRNIVANINAAKNTNIKFVLKFGGNSPNDSQCLLRLTWDVVKWGDYCDGLQTAFGKDNRSGDAAITLDYVQNYPNKKLTELNHGDFDKINDTVIPIDQVKTNMIASGTAAIQNGAREIIFITMEKFSDYYKMTKEIFAELKPLLAQNNENTRTGITKNTFVTLGELLSTSGKKGVERWTSVGGSSNSRANIVLNNSLNASTSDLPYSLSLTNISTFYFRQLDMKNSVYGRRLDTDTSPYTDVQVDYNTNRVGMIVSTHGITYKAGAKTKSTITIKSKTVNPNVVWLKMEQTTGVTDTESNGDYRNNHPELRYIPNISEDCRFWFPLDDYDIIIDVQDAGCLFSVMNPNTLAPNRFVSENNVSAGSQSTVTVLKSTMLTQTNPDHRLIKINNNRNSDTP